MGSSTLNKLGQGVGAAMTSVGMVLVEDKRQERLAKVRATAADRLATATTTAANVKNTRAIEAAKLRNTQATTAAGQLTTDRTASATAGAANDIALEKERQTGRVALKKVPTGGKSGRGKATAPKPVGNSGDFIIGYENGSLDLYDSETKTTSTIEKDSPAAKALREKEKSGVANAVEAEEIFELANTPKLFEKWPWQDALDLAEDGRWKGNDAYVKAEIADMLDRGYEPVQIYGHLLDVPIQEYEAIKPKSLKAAQLGATPEPVPIGAPTPTGTPKPTMIANGDGKSAQLEQRLESMRTAIAAKYPDMSRTDVDAAIASDSRFKNLHPLLTKTVAKR